MYEPQIRRGSDAKAFFNHVKNVKNATAKVDDKPPRLPVGAYVKDASFYGDIFRLRNVELQNRDLLKNINVIYRTKGKTDCQLEKYKRTKTQFYKQIQELEKYQNRNQAFLGKLEKKVKSHYALADHMRDWKKILKVMRFTARYPEFYDKKPSHLATWTLCPPGVTSDSATHEVCFMDLKIGDLPRLYRMEIEVYSDIVPATSANFVSLCKGFGELSYRDSPFHRIVPGLLCIGGDIVNHSGTGGLSIYGESFPDENFELQHNGPGVVGMYALEPGHNNSQFFVTFRKLSTLNGKYVVIGRVTSSYKMLRLIESCGTKGGKPLQSVKVVDCGVY